MKSMIENIKAWIDKLNKVKNLKPRSQQSLERAKEWVANGCFSTYSNEDFDILNGLVCNFSIEYKDSSLSFVEEINI